VYPASFEYLAPTTADEAVALLQSHGEDAKILAGGQSLIPLMKLRFAAPSVLIDINHVQDISDQITAGPDGLRIGARVRHRACERSEALHGRYGTLGAAAPQISDPIVRNQGTVCGSVAHADPQGDWGSALMAMDGQVVARSAKGERTVPISEFFQGPLMTVLGPDELITEIRVPDPGPRSGGTYLKLERRVGDFATVAVAAHVTLSNGSIGRAGIALTGVGPANLRASAAEQALAGRAPDEAAITEAARLAAEAAQPRADVRGSVEFKRNVVRVFTERALRAAVQRAQAGEGG